MRSEFGLETPSGELEEFDEGRVFLGVVALISGIDGYSFASSESRSIRPLR